MLQCLLKQLVINFYSYATSIKDEYLKILKSVSSMQVNLENMDNEAANMVTAIYEASYDIKHIKLESKM